MNQSIYLVHPRIKGGEQARAYVWRTHLHQKQGSGQVSNPRHCDPQGGTSTTAPSSYVISGQSEWHNCIELAKN